MTKTISMGKKMIPLNLKSAAVTKKIELNKRNLFFCFWKNLIRKKQPKIKKSEKILSVSNWTPVLKKIKSVDNKTKVNNPTKPPNNLVATLSEAIKEMIAKIGPT